MLFRSVSQSRYNDALEEDLTDGSEDIYEGRFELAQSLLERIEIWEKENGTNK